tara:strand:+ start:173 stop:712 length:540 start_codon:yes stop_codon:yes gene_type:complete
MGKMQWPGDKNENEETRFRFLCKGCERGKEKFHCRYPEPGPKLVPSGIDCPFCGEWAEWCLDGVPAMKITGNVGSISNPHYSRKRAEAEHKWMEYQIDGAKKALSGEDQITGDAANPYGKFTMNMEEAQKRGIAQKLDETTAEQKKRIIDERAKIVADQASDKINNEFEKKHVGRRHDG